MAGLFAAGIGILFALLFDVLSSRAGLSRVGSYGVSLAGGTIMSIIAAAVLGQGSPAAFAVAVPAYGAWWFIALNLIQALESSLRVRLLREVMALGGRIPIARLEARYNDRWLLGLRLSRLRDAGAIVERDGRLFVVSPGLRAVAGFFRLLKRVCIGRLSEFESPPV
jgi:hypothetical protein